MSRQVLYPTVVDEHGAQQFREGATYPTLVEAMSALWREFGDDAYAGWFDGFATPFKKDGVTVAYLKMKED